MKTLGYNKHFKLVRPGEYSSILPGFKAADISNNELTGDEDDETVTNNTLLPPFERLILWKECDENDDNKQSTSEEIVINNNNASSVDQLENCDNIDSSLNEKMDKIEVIICSIVINSILVT